MRLGSVGGDEAETAERPIPHATHVNGETNPLHPPKDYSQELSPAGSCASSESKKLKSLRLE